MINIIKGKIGYSIGGVVYNIDSILMEYIIKYWKNVSFNINKTI